MIQVSVVTSLVISRDFCGLDSFPWFAATADVVVDTVNTVVVAGVVVDTDTVFVDIVVDASAAIGHKRKKNYPSTEKMTTLK